MILLFALAGLALTPAEPANDISVTLTVSQRGTYIYALGANGRPVADFDKSVQALPGCRWIANEGGVVGGGRCRGVPQLHPGAADFVLQLGPIVEALTRESNHAVRLTVTLPRSLPETVPVPTGWHVVDNDSDADDDDDDYGGDYTRHSLEFLSQNRQLPADLSLPIGVLGRIQEPTAYLALSLDSLHRLSISTHTSGQLDFPAELWARFSSSLPCKGRPSQSAIKGWLSFACRTPLMTLDAKQTTAPIRLAPLVNALHSAGFGKVVVTLESDSKLPAMAGWESQSRISRGWMQLNFTSNSAAQLPPELPLPAEPPVNLKPVLWQAIIVVLAPGLVAAIVRWRVAQARDGRKMNWLVAMQWINLIFAVYWIASAGIAPIAAFVDTLELPNAWIDLVAAVSLTNVPLFAGIALCLLIMRPLLTSSARGFMAILSGSLLGLATYQIPVTLVMISGRFLSGPASVLIIPAGYFVYRALAWANQRVNSRSVVAVDSGPLFERTRALAAKAGVTVSRISIIHSRFREEINAFAMSGGRVAVTDNLLKEMTEREVDAILAHELGHHKAGHLRFSWMPILYVGAFVLGSAIPWLLEKTGLPPWIGYLPLPTLLAVFANGLISQAHEFEADRAAVALTGDAEGKIAALGRLTRVTGHPVTGSGPFGWIMTHPSMEARVLALARRFGLADERALAILDNPDEAYGLLPLVRAVGLDETGPAPVAPVFSERARVNLSKQQSWLVLLIPIIGMALLYALPFNLRSSVPIFLRYRWGGLAFGALLLLGPPLVFGLLLYLLGLLDRRFCAKMRAGLAAKLNPASDAECIGIHPGHGVRFTDGFSETDMGFLTLEGEWLCYRGERLRFAVDRNEITNVALVAGPPRWKREWRVEVEFRGGAFTLVDPASRSIEGVEHWIREWRAQAAMAAGAQPAPEAAPQLPDLPGMTESRVMNLWHAAKESGKVLLLGTGFSMLSPTAGFTMGAVIAFLIPLVYLAPNVAWPLRAPIRRSISPAAARSDAEKSPESTQPI